MPDQPAYWDASRPWGIPDAAAVPVPDAGDDTLRDQLARIACEALDWRWLPERTETGHTLVPSPTEAIMPAIDALLASGRIASTERGTTHFEWGVRNHEGHVGLHASEHSARETYEAQRDWMFPPQGLIVRTVTTLRTEWGAVEGIADELTERGFMGWFVANSMSDLWAERTPEQEIGRVAAHALLPLIRDHIAKAVQTEREQIFAAITAAADEHDRKIGRPNGTSAGLRVAARIALHGTEATHDR